jgi:hypothetical protein
MPARGAAAALEPYIDCSASRHRFVRSTAGRLPSLRRAYATGLDYRPGPRMDSRIRGEKEFNPPSPRGPGARAGVQDPPHPHGPMPEVSNCDSGLRSPGTGLPHLARPHLVPTSPRPARSSRSVIDRAYRLLWPDGPTARVATDRFRGCHEWGGSALVQSSELGTATLTK